MTNRIVSGLLAVAISSVAIAGCAMMRDERAQDRSATTSPAASPAMPDSGNLPGVEPTNRGTPPGTTGIGPSGSAIEGAASGTGTGTSGGSSY